LKINTIASLYIEGMRYDITMFIFFMEA